MKTSLLVLAVSMIARAAAPVTTLANFPNSMVYAVQTDATGNIYVGGFQGNFAKANPFVAKLTPTGQTLYSTTLAGSNFGIAWAIAVDSSGAVYAFGSTNSPDFPVTPGALQTTMQGSFQGFVTKLDPSGKIVYSTFVGGATEVTPGLTSAPGLDSILVDSAGDVVITGQTRTKPMTPPFLPPSAPIVSSSESFVLKLDPAGAKILGGIGGIGGMVTTDRQGNIYVTGLEYGDGQTPQTPLSVTPGAFQSEPADVCSFLHNFFECGYQYVAKLNPALDRVLYATFVSGEYGATPAAISVDAEGDAFVVGTTESPDYPTTPDAYEPQYIASAPPNQSCFFSPNCVNLPPASGYLTEVNPSGTGLVYSSYFSGTQTDSINFAAFTPNEIYLGGSAGSADLPGLVGYPQPCLPQMYATHLSADATEIGATRVSPDKILAYDAFAGTLLGTSGSDVVAIDPNGPQPTIACILDSADFSPVTSVAPGQLLSLFGEFSIGQPSHAAAGRDLDFARRRHGRRQRSLQRSALRRRRADQLPGALFNCRCSASQYQPHFRALEPLGLAHAADRGEQPGGISQHRKAVAGARDLHGGERRIRQRSVAAGLESGRLGQHLSESRARGFHRDAVSQRPGSDVIPGCYRQCWDGGLSLGDGKCYLRHLGSECPDTG